MTTPTDNDPGLARDIEKDVEELVWRALFFDHLARAIWLGIAFQRGRWRGKRLLISRDAA